MKWLFSGVMALALCSCASDNGVQVTSQTSTQYAPVPVSNCRVSSHPPKGKYTVIATLSVKANIGETPTQVLNRLQQQGAAIGADYVMVTSVSDKTFLTPQNLDPNENIYLATSRNFDSTANTPQYDNGQSYMAEVITGQALKITSGSHAPNKAAPSNLWQVNN